MTEQQFCYWLNGFIELNGGALPSEAQWKAIVEHMGTVFKKVTPPLLSLPSRPLDPPPTNTFDWTKQWDRPSAIC